MMCGPIAKLIASSSTPSQSVQLNRSYGRVEVEGGCFLLWDTLIIFENLLKYIQSLGVLDMKAWF
jgi:hypothetical protein